MRQLLQFVETLSYLAKILNLLPRSRQQRNTGQLLKQLSQEAPQTGLVLPQNVLEVVNYDEGLFCSKKRVDLLFHLQVVMLVLGPWLLHLSELWQLPSEVTSVAGLGCRCQ